MWISRKEYNKVIERYERRIDDLLNRLMSRNVSEYEVAKQVKIPTTDKELENLSRSDEIEYEIEQKRPIERHGEDVDDVGVHQSAGRCPNRSAPIRNALTGRRAGRLPNVYRKEVWPRRLGF